MDQTFIALFVVALPEGFIDDGPVDHLVPDRPAGSRSPPATGGVVRLAQVGVSRDHLGKLVGDRSPTQFYFVGFTQSRNGVQKCVFNKRTIEVCVSFF